MTINDIRPAPGARYRDRLSGREVTVRNYCSPGDRTPLGFVRVIDDSGAGWVGSVAEFWDKFINAKLPDPNLN